MAYGISKEEETDVYRRYPTMKDGTTLNKCTFCGKWHPAWAMRTISQTQRWCFSCIMKNKNKPINKAS